MNGPYNIATVRREGLKLAIPPSRTATKLYSDPVIRISSGGRSSGTPFVPGLGFVGSRRDSYVVKAIDTAGADNDFRVSATQASAQVGVRAHLAARRGERRGKHVGRTEQGCEQDEPSPHI